MALASNAQQFGNPNDPWALSSNAYDPAKFYVRATDGNGHDNLMQVKLSPALMGQLQHVLETHVVPEYRTKADIVRDALIHRLRWINDEYPGAVNLHDLEIEQRQAELDRISTQREAWKKYLSDLDNQLRIMIEEREYDEAEWLIEANEWNESMTPPYLVKLAKILNEHRNRIKRETTATIETSARITAHT